MIDRSNYLPPFLVASDPEFVQPEPIKTPDYLLMILFGLGIYYLVK